jgi:ferredoxin
MRFYSNRTRTSHLGPLPLERLTRAAAPHAGARGVAQPGDANAAGPDAITPHAIEYRDLFRRFLDGPVAPAKAPVPEDPKARADNLKSSAYFLDAIAAGCCALDAAESAACGGHTHAMVCLVEFGREPQEGEPGAAWIRGANVARTDLRATELAVVLSGYVRWLGWNALGHAGVEGHAADTSALDLTSLALRAGLVTLDAQGQLAAPFLRRGFRIAAITTDWALAPDAPLAEGIDLHPADPACHDGTDGTRPGWYYEEEAKRPLHMSAWPMEDIPHVDQPSTLVIREEIQRVPKRGDFFKRAEAGDLGDKPQRERRRFPMKHPLALGMQPLIQHMVPLQGTRETFPPSPRAAEFADPVANAQAIKALAYFLGADFVGICEAEPWMYYSHEDQKGEPLPAYHRYAVVMLIDQGWETMEGASGDDWISASQSMRAYLRGAEMAGVMAAHCRRLGWSSRAHSNAHSEVIHNPAILMAGLGEVSRIGDTILNPFIGPRSKSVVFTTDFPMALDRPIDFGLQDFCNQCRKCARECPCNAITFGPKVMFNGYEIWKADVEKCTRYRVTQMRGSACGRCMKMCPWNREDTVASRELMWRSIREPEARAGIIAADDAEGNGIRNPAKRWWFDLEVVDGVAVLPPSGTNERDLNLGRDAKLAAAQKLAMFPPALQPPAGASMAEVHPIDRVAGQQRYQEAESPEAARARLDSAGR